MRRFNENDIFAYLYQPQKGRKGLVPLICRDGGGPLDGPETWQKVPQEKIRKKRGEGKNFHENRDVKVGGRKKAPTDGRLRVWVVPITSNEKKGNLEKTKGAQTPSVKRKKEAKVYRTWTVHQKRKPRPTRSRKQKKGATEGGGGLHEPARKNAVGGGGELGDWRFLN